MAGRARTGICASNCPTSLVSSDSHILLRTTDAAELRADTVDKLHWTSAAQVVDTVTSAQVALSQSPDNKAGHFDDAFNEKPEIGCCNDTIKYGIDLAIILKNCRRSEWVSSLFVSGVKMRKV